MKFVFSNLELISRLQVASKVINPNNILPILHNFYLRIEGTKLTIIASDKENTLKTQMDLVESEKDVVFTVNASTFLEGLKDIPEQPVECIYDEQTGEIEVKHNCGHFILLAEAAENFPDFIDVADDAKQLTVDSKFLLNALNRSMSVAAVEQSRPIMTGLYFDIINKELTVVASDGHRLVCNTSYGSEDFGECNFILPRKPASLIKTIIGKEEETVQFKFDDKNVVVNTEKFCLVGKLLEGRYPNYKAVVPKDTPYTITVDRVELLNATRRINNILVSTAKDRRDSVKFLIESNQIKLEGKSLEYGTFGEERVNCTFDGPATQIGFDPSGILDVLTGLEESVVTIHLIDNTRSCIVSPEVKADAEGVKEKVFYLLMPIMINS